MKIKFENNKRKVQGFVFMFLLIIICCLCYSLKINAVDRNIDNLLRLDNDLVPIERIAINEDSDFSDYGFPGTGSANDPYIIEKYIITQTIFHGIVIYETTKHFIIRDCYINSSSYGILLFWIQAKTAIITNNTCINSYSSCDSCAIRVYESDFVTITNNTIIDSKSSIEIIESKSPIVHNNTCYITLDNLVYASGIFIDACDSASVKFNNCTNVPKGYILSSCNSSVFTNNYAQENSLFGVWISSSNYTIVNDNMCIKNGNYGIILNSTNYSSVNNNILYLSEYNLYSKLSHYLYASNNTCSSGLFGIYLDRTSSSVLLNNTCENTNYGIYLSKVGSLEILNNICKQNSIYGMKLVSTYNSKFHFNMIKDNVDYGIYVDANSKNNSITYNSFIDNKVGENYTQAYDAGSDNVWYNFTTKEGNYWSDLGENKTYTIDGPAGSIDKYPLNEDLERTSQKFYFMVFTLIILSIVSIRRRKLK